MSLISRRTLQAGVTAASVGALLMLAAAPAFAIDPGANSRAFGIRVSVLAGAISVPATPTSTFPPGGTNHLVSVNLGALGTVGASNATTDGNSAAGTSSATGSVANAALLSNLASGLPAVSADLISASCSDTAPAAPTGQSTFTNATIGTTAIVNVTPAANTKLLNVPGVLVATLNQQTLANGVLTVNALHLQAGPIVNGRGTLADVVIGQAVCGPNTAAPPVDSFSFGQLPVILGGMGILALLAYGLRNGVRRLRPTA